MSTDHINLLQGRKVQGVAHEHYIRIRPETLKEEYIKALPYLVVEDVNKYRTENEILREENLEYKAKEDKINSILERLERLENS